MSPKCRLEKTWENPLTRASEAGLAYRDQTTCCFSPLPAPRRPYETAQVLNIVMRHDAHTAYCRER